MTDCSWREDVGAYLLFALSDTEHEAFESHMAGCGECRAEVDELRVAADALPNSPVQMSPPGDLKDRIMTIVNREAELLRAAGPEADRIPASKRPGRKVVAVLRPGWWTIRPGLALAATLLILVVGAGGALVGRSAFGHDDTVTVARLGSAKLIQRHTGHSTLVAQRLHAPAVGHVYQVWLLHKGATTPKPTNALFSPGKDGSASVDVPGSLDDVSQVLVTEEPEGGSTTPTTNPIIVARPS